MSPAPPEQPPVGVAPRITATTEVVLVDSTDRVVAYSHRDHWHGFPVVPVTSGLRLRMAFSNEVRDSDDHDMPSRQSWFTLDQLADHNVRMVIADTTAARWSGDAVWGRFTGLRANGATTASIVVRRATTTLNERPPLNLVIR
ncbi:MAG: hypothetical protein MUF21_15510 [Gemmatimonadaceae bacterium]|nr:hypothetical protein [Gemmatimonadaceae bacterium]